MYLADLLLVVAILMNFLALGAREMRVCIRAAALQGAVLSILPLLVHRDPGVNALLMAAGAAAMKGILIPTLLQKAMRDVHVAHEVEPYVGFVPSLFLAGIGTALAILFADRLPLAPEHVGSLIVPASLATLFSGFLLMTTRRKAIMQVVGYLLLENGVYVFGLLLIEAMSFLVEVGVLLDLLVAIFIMGIVLNHIRREFSSLDTEQLAGLRE